VIREQGRHVEREGDRAAGRDRDGLDRGERDDGVLLVVRGTETLETVWPPGRLMMTVQPGTGTGPGLVMVTWPW